MSSADLPFHIEEQNTAYCVVHAAREFMVPPEALLAMIMQEAGKPGMKSPNSNGSFDLGVAQINTVWLKDGSPLKYYVNENQLAYDTCANIHVAAWILTKHYRKSGDIWRAIGMYHSPGNMIYQWKYVQAVNRHLPRARQILSYQPWYQYYVSVFFGASTAAQPAAQQPAPAVIYPGRQ